MSTGLRGIHTTAKWLMRGGVVLLAWALPNAAQSAPQQPETQHKPETQQQQQSPPAKNDSNPFPEDTNSVPVISNSAPAPEPETAAAPARAPAYDFDPVRSPDEPIGEPASDTEQGFSSSSSGLNLPTPADATDNDTPNSKHRRRQGRAEPTHVETAQEDESVGAYYMSEKNWRAALSRFQSALVLDPENPDVYWGLAESQRHLGDVAHARENYQKVMEYDPDSRHAKDAKKLLASPEMAHADAAPRQH